MQTSFSGLALTQCSLSISWSQAHTGTKESKTDLLFVHSQGVYDLNSEMGKLSFPHSAQAEKCARVRKSQKGKHECCCDGLEEVLHAELSNKTRHSSLRKDLSIYGICRKRY
jgi:hypothetical protein